MTKVQAFAAKCPPGSSHPECQFPVLAGSHLTEVRAASVRAPLPPACPRPAIMGGRTAIPATRLAGDARTASAASTGERSARRHALPARTPAPAQEELGSPALAFVRTACHLLALDAAVSNEVALLRRRLLKLLGVGEFGSAAQFREPCMSFRLPDVICGWAGACVRAARGGAGHGATTGSAAAVHGLRGAHGGKVQAAHHFLARCHVKTGTPWQVAQDPPCA